MKKLLCVKQGDTWTCGPTVMQIVLDYFGIKKDIRTLIKELHTIRNQGTDNRHFLKLLKKYKLKFRAQNRSNLKVLKKLLSDSLVVVGYWIPYYRESHYALISRISRDRVYLHDTWFGHKHSYKIDYFLKNWWDEESQQWLVAIKLPRSK